MKKLIFPFVYGLFFYFISLVSLSQTFADEPLSESLAQAIALEKIRIAFITVLAGDGHLQIGKAVTNAIDSEAEKLNLTLSVFLTPGKDGRLEPTHSLLLNPYLTASQKILWEKVYHIIAAHFPLAWEIAYTNIGRVIPHSLRKKSMEQYLDPRLILELMKDDPQVIVAMHPLLVEIVNVMKEVGLVSHKLKVINMVTDFSVTPLYNTEGLIIVPHESLRQKLISWGKDPHLVVTVNGIPARSEFYESYDAETVRAELSQSNPAIGGSIPLIVATGGGDGYGLDQIREFLPNWHPETPVKMVIICGHNNSEYEKLTDLLKTTRLDPNVTIIPMGYVKPIHLYLKAADVIIGKPGGSALAEVIALKKGLFSHMNLAGQENRNRELLSELGVIQTLKLVDLNSISKVLGRRDSMVQAIEKEFPNASLLPNQIAEIIAKYGRGEIIDDKLESEALERRLSRRALTPFQRACRKLLEVGA